MARLLPARSRGLGCRVDEESTPEAEDERPPVCPACGVTMGMVLDEHGTTRYVCLECGFSENDAMTGSEPRSPRR